MPVSSSIRCNPYADAAELLAAASAGDETAWAFLARSYSGLLRHICRRYRLTPEQTDDALQNTWTALFTHAARIRNAGGLTSWLTTTVSRECLSLRRRESREIPTDNCGYDCSDGASIDTDVHDRLDTIVRVRSLRRAMATLPPRERTLIQILLEPDPLSYAEISRRLGMPIGAIGPVRQRALRHLRDQLTVVLESGMEASA